MTIRFVSLLVLASLVFAASCKRALPPQPPAPPIPSASEVENAVRKLVNSRYGGNLKLLSFAKTAGIPNELPGNNGYTTFYDVSFEFMTNGFWMPHANPRDEDGWIFGWVQSQTPTEMEKMTSWEERLLFHTGQQGRLSTQISAIQSERGWQFDSSRGKITKSELIQTAPQ